MGKSNAVLAIMLSSILLGALAVKSYEMKHSVDTLTIENQSLVTQVGDLEIQLDTVIAERDQALVDSDRKADIINALELEVERYKEELELHQQPQSIEEISNSAPGELCNNEGLHNTDQSQTLYEQGEVKSQILDKLSPLSILVIGLETFGLLFAGAYHRHKMQQSATHQPHRSTESVKSADGIVSIKMTKEQLSEYIKYTRTPKNK